jgi:Domain of unknown function (DUF4249)
VALFRETRFLPEYNFMCNKFSRALTKISCWAIIILLASCIKEVDYLAPPFTPQLVLSSIINPDSLIKAHVGKTIAITDTGSAIVETASVFLLKNGVPIDTLVYQSDGWYVSDVYPQVGFSYRLQTHHPVFSSVSSECKVPPPPQIDSLFFTVGEMLDQEGIPITRFTLRLNDPDPNINYYELILYSGNPLDPIIQPMPSTRIIQLDDPTLIADANWNYAPSTLFFSDALFNGINGEVSFNLKWGGYPSADDPPYYIVLRNISSSYYQYLKSWSVHRFNQNSTQNTRDPLTLLFQGDPVELYTNVNNGYGIFGAYNQTLQQATFTP